MGTAEMVLYVNVLRTDYTLYHTRTGQEVRKHRNSGSLNTRFYSINPIQE